MRRPLLALLAAAAFASTAFGPVPPPVEVPDRPNPFPLGTCVRVHAVSPDYTCVMIDPDEAGAEDASS